MRPQLPRVRERDDVLRGGPADQANHRHTGTQTAREKPRLLRDY